jgi:hypothetical protein
MPYNICTAATRNPHPVTGYTSPYPNVAIVTALNHIECGMDWNGDSSVTATHASDEGRSVVQSDVGAESKGASGGVERRRGGVSGLKPRGGRRETIASPGKVKSVLKE